MKIEWALEAASDLTGIFDHIADDSLESAARITDLILERLEQLTHFPHKGCVGSELGTRELVFAPLPYLAVYRLTETSIQILHIWHGAQER